MKVGGEAIVDLTDLSYVNSEFLLKKIMGHS